MSRRTAVAPLTLVPLAAYSTSRFPLAAISMLELAPTIRSRPVAASKPVLSRT